MEALIQATRDLTHIWYGKKKLKSRYLLTTPLVIYFMLSILLIVDLNIKMRETYKFTKVLNVRIEYIFR
jgi:hypothetical protein